MFTSPRGGSDLAEETSMHQQQQLAYKYQLLESNQIRILDLLSPPHQPLQCRLRAVHFEDGRAAHGSMSHDGVDNLQIQFGPVGSMSPLQGALPTARPSYTALSYVWGAQAKQFSMEIVDEKDHSLGYIPLTANLQHALEDLRDSPADAVAAKTFWIDQICINQSDSVEKNYQVGRMKQIYETAAQVITYLGPEEAGDGEAYGLLQRIGASYAHQWRWATEEDGLFESHFDFDTAENAQAAYTCLRQFLFSSGWCYRLWLVQENVVNPYTGFLRGLRYIPWNTVAMLADLSLRTGLSSKGVLPKLLCMEFITVCDLQSLRDGRFGPEKTSFSLSDLLKIFPRYSHSWDVRDKIFSLLGLADDAERRGIVPEYERCPAQVFTDLAINFLRDAPSPDAADALMVLEDVAIEPMPDRLFPTWVPSYMYGTRLRLSTSAARQNCLASENPQQQQQQQPTSLLLSSSQDDSVHVNDACISFRSTRQIENGILVIHGLRGPPLGENLGTFECNFYSVMAAHELRHFISFFEKMKTRLDSGSGSDGTHATTSASHGDDSDKGWLALCRTILMNQDWPEEDAGLVDSSSSKEAVDALRSVAGALALAEESEELDSPTTTASSDAFRVPFLHSADVSPATAYIIKESGALAWRSVWTVGRAEEDEATFTFALAPHSVRQGDIPVILLGGRFIYFLRPTTVASDHFHDSDDNDDSGNGGGNDDVYYEYLGHGYIDGLMKGEALRGGAWREEVETFRIK